MTIQTIGVLLTGVSVSVAATYYILALRNTNKARKTQLLLHIIERIDNKDYWKLYYEMLHHWEWEDFDDFWRKYGYETNLEDYSTYMEIHSINEGLGLLVKHDMIDVDMVNDWMGSLFTDVWNKMKPINDEFRKRYNAPRRWEWFEFLNEKLTNN